MKALILAAGQGLRLRPLTNDKPKCMVRFEDKPIIRHIIDTMRKVNIHKIGIVSGYKSDVLKNYLKNDKINWFVNKNYRTTNMVSTFFCAKNFFDDELIISYGDIIYKECVLRKLIENDADFCVVIDKNWKELWKLRMENPLDDAETLRIENNRIIELGKKPKKIDDIQGQYIGLIKISKHGLFKLTNFYKSINKSDKFDGQSFDNMYMTSLIQLIIENISHVSPVIINGGWLEIDNLADLRAYKIANLLS